MKLAPAIEEFIRYKQALGNSYTTPARALKHFLDKPGMSILMNSARTTSMRSC